MEERNGFFCATFHIIWRPIVTKNNFITFIWSLWHSTTTKKMTFQLSIKLILRYLFIEFHNWKINYLQLLPFNNETISSKDYRRKCLHYSSGILQIYKKNVEFHRCGFIELWLKSVVNRCNYKHWIIPYCFQSTKIYLFQNNRTSLNTIKIEIMFHLYTKDIFSIE